MVIFPSYNSYICISYRHDYSRGRNVRGNLESESEQQEAHINRTKVVEGPDQSSEEPKANLAQEGKPRSINPIFSICNAITSMYLCIEVNRSLLKP